MKSNDEIMKSQYHSTPNTSNSVPSTPKVTKVPRPSNINIPSPHVSINFNSTSLASSLDNISNGSPKRNMQNTFLKLHAIVQDKSNLINIQKQRIEKLNKKLYEDELTISQLQKNYQEHQASLSQLQQENQNLQQTFNELKSNYNLTNNTEFQELYDKIKQFDLETEQMITEIPLLEQKVAHLQEESINQDQVESLLASKNYIIEDNKKVKNQIIEFEAYKEKCQQLEIQIPEIQERVDILQEEVNSSNSVLINNQYLTKIDQLKKENTLLKNQFKDEKATLIMSRDKYSKLKLELETKVELQKEINILQDNLLKNQHFINEIGQNIQNGDQYLNSLKNINKKRHQDVTDMKNYLASLKEEARNVKSQVIQLMRENGNNKKMLNDNLEGFVNQNIEKSEVKLRKLIDKENIMKKEMKEMKKIVEKLEIDVNGIVLLSQKICAERDDALPETISTFDFTDKNFTNLGESIQKVEDNNYLISSLIEENTNIKESVANAQIDECPPLPKEAPEVRAAKFGLY